MVILLRDRLPEMQIDELIQGLPENFTPADRDLVMRAYKTAESCPRKAETCIWRAVYFPLHRGCSHLV